jgi:hypothetical protein
MSLRFVLEKAANFEEHEVCATFLRSFGAVADTVRFLLTVPELPPGLVRLWGHAILFPPHRLSICNPSN